MIQLLKFQSLLNAALIPAIFAVLTLTNSALGQGGARVMVLNGGDIGPVISHFSMPDLISLREPDFLKRDLPIFNEKLVLSEAQSAAIERQIEIYLEAFEELIAEHLKFPGAEPMLMKGMRGLQPPGEVLLGPENLDDLPIIALDELGQLDEMMEGPDEIGFNVGVFVGAPIDSGEDDAGAGEGPRAKVAIGFRGRDGGELPEEVREQLEKRAVEMAEKFHRQLEEQMADGLPPGEPPLLPGLGVADLEQIKERQDAMAISMKAFRKGKTDLRLRFVNDAHAKLSTEQIEYWPALERALRREKSLPKGRLSGERTDLFKAINAIDVAPANQSHVSANLDGYDLAMDNALRQRDELLQDVSEKVDNAIRDKNFDRALSLLDRAAAVRVAVRSINEQFTESIAGILPEEMAQPFRMTVAKTGYPQLYRLTFAEKTFAAAHKLDGLDDATHRSLSELEGAYRVELDEANARIRRAIDKHQPLEPRRPIERMKAMIEAGPPQEMMNLGHDDPVADAFAKRRALDERYVKSLANLLTPEQFDQLPKPPVRRPAREPIIIRSVSPQ